MSNLVILTSGFVVSLDMGNLVPVPSKMSNDLSLFTKSELIDTNNEYRLDRANEKLTNYSNDPSFDNLQLIRNDLIRVFKHTGLKEFFSLQANNKCLSNVGFEVLKDLVHFNQIYDNDIEYEVYGSPYKGSKFLVSSFRAAEGEISSTDLEDRYKEIRVLLEDSKQNDILEDLSIAMFRDVDFMLELYSKIFVV